MQYVKSTIYGLVFIVLVILLGWLVYQKVELPKGMKDTYILVGNARFKVAIADTPEEQAAGLSGVTNLNKNSGIYFLFDSPVQQSFWNKGMLIPFDLLWIRDKKVIGIERRIRSESEGFQSVTPPSEIDGVLEIADDQADNSGISVGDEVKYLW